MGDFFGTPAQSSGKSQSTSDSWNQAFPWLQQQLGGTVSTGAGATNQMAALLGIGGDQGAAEDAFRQYQESTGYQTAVNEAMRGVTGSAAAKGLLNSGATAKALQDRASQLGTQSFNNYLGQLGGVAQQGQGAAGIIGGAGGRSTGQSTSEQQSTGEKAGLGQIIGGLLGGIAPLFGMFSDRRMKTDIKLLGRMPDGLGVYQYRYHGGPEVHVGVMADEVAEIRPWALGPEVGGYATVYYGLL